MKNVILIVLAGIVLSLGALNGDGQVQCRMTVEGGAPLKQGDALAAKITAVIEEGSHIGSLTTPNGGSERTTITLRKDQLFKQAGEIIFPAPKVMHSSVANAELETYEGEVTFVVPLRATADIGPGAELAVIITYQACSDESCLIPVTKTLTATLAPAAPTSQR